jgi:hypothetical protein
MTQYTDAEIEKAYVGQTVTLRKENGEFEEHTIIQLVAPYRKPTELKFLVADESGLFTTVPYEFIHRLLQILPL